jgi:hypothetical protein
MRKGFHFFGTTSITKSDGDIATMSGEVILGALGGKSS